MQTWLPRLIVVMVALSPVVVCAQGPLAPPGPPGPTMVTLDQLHDGITDVSASMADLMDAVGDVNFDELLVMLAALTNGLAAIGQQTEQIPQILGHMDDDLHVMTNQLDAVEAGVDGLTNALAGLDWTDVVKIRADVEYLTNILAVLEGLDVLATEIGALTNVMHGVVVEIGAGLPVISNQLDGVAAQLAAIDTALSAQDAELALLHAIELENNTLLHNLTNAP